MKPNLEAVAFLAVLGVITSSPSAAQPSEGVAEAVIIATNSVDLDRNVQISGNVVVNQASTGPTLDGGVELNVDKVSVSGIRTAEGDLFGDSVVLNKFANIIGVVHYNEIFPDPVQATVGGLETPLALPVFAQLPAFQVAMVPAGAPDVVVGTGGSATLDEGDWGAVVVGVGGTLTVTGGVYNIRSLTLDQTANLVFSGASDIRVEGRLRVGKGSFVGPEAGSDVAVSEIVLYVGGMNGSGGGLLESPLAAEIGREGVLSANVYAPAGTISIGRSTTATGGFFGRDVWVKTGAIVILENFVNGPPKADPKVVFTDGQASIDITLSGSDPEDSSLIFDIVAGSGPSHGTLSAITPIEDPGQCSAGPTPVGGCTLDSQCDTGETCVLPPITEAIVTYTPDDPEANLADSFQYTVEDEGQLVSAPATVEINPVGDPTPGEDPIAFVDASDVVAETTTNTSVTISLAASPPGFCSLSGAVCGDLEDGDPETTDSTDCPLNQDGDPGTSETCDADPLDFFVESLPSGSLSDPLLGSIETVPFDLSSSKVIYTPVTDFASGICTISGDLCEVDGDCLPDGGTCVPPDEFDFSAAGVQGGSDTATVFVNVFAAEELAEDLSFETSLNTPVQITLRANLGGTGTSGNAPLTAPQEADAPAVSGIGATSSLGFEGSMTPALGAAQALGVAQAQAQTPRIDFGVTPDDFGDANPCSGGSTLIDTQYVDTKSIVFGTAVEFPNGPRPGVRITLDGAFAEPCRSSGSPSFLTDWWAQFKRGAGPGQPGDRAGVNQFSAEIGGFNGVCSISGAACFPVFVPCPDPQNETCDPDTIPDLYAYDINGKLLDQATSTVLGGQTLTVSDPEGDKQIAFVHVDSSEDAFGLTVDLLNYDEPAAIETPLILTYKINSLPTSGNLTFGGEPVFVGQTFTAAPTLVYASSAPGTYSFTYSVTEAAVTDLGTVTVLVDALDTCTPVGREPGCSPSGGGEQAPVTGGGETAVELEPSAPSDGFTVVVEGVGGSVSTSPVELADGRLLTSHFCAAGTCSKRMPAGALVSLFARPDGDHYEFVGWGGDCWGTDPIITVKLTDETVCTATFQRKAAD